MNTLLKILLIIVLAALALKFAPILLFPVSLLALVGLIMLCRSGTRRTA